jgi:hypothetical protein
VVAAAHDVRNGCGYSATWLRTSLPPYAIGERSSGVCVAGTLYEAQLHVKCPRCMWRRCCTRYDCSLEALSTKGRLSMLPSAAQADSILVRARTCKWMSHFHVCLMHCYILQNSSPAALPHTWTGCSAALNAPQLLCIAVIDIVLHTGCEPTHASSWALIDGRPWVWHSSHQMGACSVCRMENQA